MYISAEEIEDYIAQSPNPQLLRQVTQLVKTVFPDENLRYFDNGRTFSALALGANPHPSQGYEEAGILNISAQKIMLRSIFMEVMWLYRSDSQSQLLDEVVCGLKIKSFS